MFKTIADPADCEVRSVIRFLNAKKVKPAEIHRQLVEIYGENVMTDGVVRKWIRQFNDGRTSVHDEARSGQPSVVNDELEEKAAKLFGKEAALFVPSGTMGNLASVMSHCWAKGQEVIVGDLSHIFIHEQGGIAQVRCFPLFIERKFKVAIK
ncbi:hypothetical protein AVEN_269330-1 [Araneus ventricosus]|uniref:Low-specificity L-threonine aldolase 2 n=1 Tax=Araneus ventricosus TaxID=182803 RepID=A0A4Y2TTD8_ARAVE|nr:hypothetical protein AVEN_269330-1 [Araneus ventricosus]